MWPSNWYLRCEPILGTIVPNMDTLFVSPALFGKARQAVLGVIFRQADDWFYLREIARKAGSNADGRRAGLRHPRTILAQHELEVATEAHRSNNHNQRLTVFQ